MVKLTTAVIALSSLYSRHVTSLSIIDESNCVPIENLGTNDLDRYEYDVNMAIDDDCNYSLSMKMKHDVTLPLPSDPMTQCVPGPNLAIASEDDLPYLAFRWAYAKVPRNVKKATGIDHITIDFNSCGHPPVNVFTIPHYDFHIYLVDPEYRSCMTCDLADASPACDPNAQSTLSGNGFLNVAKVESGPNAGKIANMPDGFVVGHTDHIPLMGGHAWNPNTVPSPWVDPIWIMGPYNGGIVDYEPMIPLSFLQGSEDHMYEETLTYVSQTISTLPTKYSAKYDGASGYLTLTLEGKSAVCNGDETKTGKKSKKAKKGKA
mmetsp:Transcript_60181/g.67334  ORF Transcript_60181/g.67334 Transcript_60181/m.67334 type:complete len:319 (+) Transcript_60181:16-972(+)|eukprot:CAMPEP_0170809206 /NCGR_PEP_ID=MMETSP0733-20121128/33891_1 /TAXON_ID=186038 /ORGANISM="Fragilariopsis kerguelensis, Strain L26-C5" /LENGTH=318 /DNA_ID=CAMNT_0011164861 /DNA_START=19 /DNA_END=975 /DNA_ORIENTATION=+